MNLQTVTDLVNTLFTYYDCNLSKLDWDNKINEYVDVINDLISFDTDLNELYKTIRQEYKYRKIPTPHDIKKILSKNKTKSEIKEYTEHPDNGKQIAITCYRGGIARECRVYVIANTPNTKEQAVITADLRKKFDEIKIYEFGKDTTIFHGCKRLEDGTIQATAEAWIPQGYNEKGEIIGYDKRKIA